jgi:hypothetical protein
MTIDMQPQHLWLIGRRKGMRIWINPSGWMGTLDNCPYELGPMGKKSQEILAQTLVSTQNPPPFVSIQCLSFFPGEAPRLFTPQKLLIIARAKRGHFEGGGAYHSLINLFLSGKDHALSVPITNWSVGARAPSLLGPANCSSKRAWVRRFSFQWTSTLLTCVGNQEPPPGQEAFYLCIASIEVCRDHDPIFTPSYLRRAATPSQFCDATLGTQSPEE